MWTKRSVPGLIAKMVAVGAVLTGLTVVAPDVYHIMSSTTAAHTVVAADSTTTPNDASPDVYHIM
jgi:hypothetical protein